MSSTKQIVDRRGSKNSENLDSDEGMSDYDFRSRILSMQQMITSSTPLEANEAPRRRNSSNFRRLSNKNLEMHAVRRRSHSSLIDMAKKPTDLIRV